MGNSCIKLVVIKRYLSIEAKSTADRPLLTKWDPIADEPHPKECMVEVSRDVIPMEDGHLSLKKGDRINVTHKDEGLWYGRNVRTCEDGFFSPDHIIDGELGQDVIPQGYSTDDKDVYEALCDNRVPEDGQLIYNKGDMIKVDSKQEISWHGRNMRTNDTGYFLAVNVEPYDSLKQCPWYFGHMKRMRAEQMLLRMGTPGTFMIRVSETVPTDYSLSLRDDDSIKHYRIKCLDTGGYYIRNKCAFVDLKVLVEHYRKSADGLARKLEHPCPVPSSEADIIVDDLWETTRERIKLTNKLGEGHFSEVWEGLWNDTIKVAVKELKNSNELDREQFLAEANIMKKLSHPKLVRLYAVCTIDEPIYIILELMSKGNLGRYLLSKEGKKLTHTELINISAQIAEGMSFLEMNNLIHRDLAARNVLVGENNSVKVADFGLSKMLDNTDHVIERENFKIALRWAAPEVISEKRFSIKSDVWSFGIVMYEIGSRGLVLNDLDTLRVGLPMDFPSLLYDSILRCCVHDLDSRPTFKTLNLELLQGCQTPSPIKKLTTV